VSYDVVNRRYDVAKASQEKRELETDWRQQMSLQYLEGYRQKVSLKIEPYQAVEDIRDLKKPLDINEVKPTGPQYLVKICVQRDQNRNVDNPAAPSEAMWTPMGNDVDEAMLLLQFIYARLALKTPAETQEQERPKPKITEPEDPFALPE